jgi:hypothetical protein
LGGDDVANRNARVHQRWRYLIPLPAPLVLVWWLASCQSYVEEQVAATSSLVVLDAQPSVTSDAGTWLLIHTRPDGGRSLDAAIVVWVEAGQAPAKALNIALLSTEAGGDAAHD